MLFQKTGQDNTLLNQLYSDTCTCFPGRRPKSKKKIVTISTDAKEKRQKGGEKEREEGRGREEVKKQR